MPEQVKWPNPWRKMMMIWHVLHNTDHLCQLWNAGHILQYLCCNAIQLFNAAKASILRTAGGHSSVQCSDNANTVWGLTENKFQDHKINSLVPVFSFKF
jgi:hypothetical protein